MDTKHQKKGISKAAAPERRKTYPGDRKKIRGGKQRK
jgi:hypothetical protein